MNLEQLRATSPVKDIYDDPTKLQLAHINTEEAHLFDQLQGYVDIDEATGFRKYLGLMPVFANPEMRAIFESTFKSVKKNPNKKIDKLKQLAEPLIGQGYERTPGDDTQEGSELIAEGKGGDDEIAFFPIPILDYFDSLLGKPSVNPETGLPQYSWLKSIGKALGKVASVVTAPVKWVTGTKHGFFGKPEKATQAYIQEANEFGKSAAKNPAVRGLAHVGTAIATGGMSIPAQMAAAAAVEGGLSRYSGNSWKDSFKDAAISGITSGAGHMAKGYGYGQGASAAIKGGTHYGATALMGRDPSLLHSGIIGAGDYLTHGYEPGSGASGLYDTAKNNLYGLFGYGSQTTPAAGNASQGLSSYAYNVNPGLAVSASNPGTGSLLGNAGTAAGAASLLGGVGGQGAQNQEAPSILSQLLQPGNLIPLAASAGLLYKGHKDEKKEARKAKEEHARESQERLNYVHNMAHNQGGIDSSLKAQIVEPDLVPNPEGPSTSDIMSGREHRWLIPREEAEAKLANRGYAKGGRVRPQREESFLSLRPGVATLVHGVGKGQDDSVVTDYLHDGDYVIDASTVANLGDGSSDAGGRELHKLMARVERSKKYIEVPTSNKRVPAMLSDKEYVIPGHIVGKLGDGDHSKGSKMLKDLVKQLRRDKIKNGDRLPPKSKGVEYYIKKAGGRI